MGALFPANRPGISLRDLYFAAPAPQTLQAPQRTLSQRVNDAVAGAGRKVGLSGRNAKKVANLADLSAVGNIASAFDAGSDIRKGNYLQGTLGALLAALPIPGPGKKLGRLFHGSNVEFDTLDLSRAGSNQERFRYPMAFLSSSPDEAAIYGKHVMEFEPLFSNPLNIDAFPGRPPMNEWEVQKFRALKQAKDNGHDAIIFDNGAQQLVVALDASKLRRTK
jgi:hypothetical protein